MKSGIRLLLLLPLALLLLFGCNRTGEGMQGGLTGTGVENLEVSDIPHDGGDGLIVSWKPLPKERRIQEYRIYRGIHPDSLFFLASVQVNVKTGVASDMMYYYDSGYSTLVDLDSPGKLKHERGQPGSILYRGVPRDYEIAARLSEKFDLYTQIPDKYYYYRSVKARSADKEDENVYAGIKFQQQTILASLRSAQPGQEPVQYYYTVVPVDERNQYLGIAKPVAGSPVDDRPDKSPGLYCVALQDTRKLHFEWEFPLNRSDLAAYMIYGIPAMADSVWNRLGEDAQQEIIASSGIPIARGPVGGGNLKNYCKLGEGEEQLLPPGLTWEAAQNLRYTIQFQDYGNPMPSPLSKLAAPLPQMSADLPLRAEYWVEDKPMDKGDRIAVTWGHPIISLTKSTTLGKQGTTLKINYQINKTDAQRISNIYFEFYEPGQKTPFVKINEFHQDNIIKIKIPQKYSLRDRDQIPSDSMLVKMTIATKPYTLNPKSGRISYGKKRLVENYVLEQYLKPDPVMMAYMPTRQLFRNGQEISSIQNVVYRKAYRGSAFSLSKRNTAYENNLDVTVPYIATIGQGVLGFNFVKNGTLWTYMNGQRFSRKLEPGEKARGLALVSSEIDLTYDAENKTVLNTSIYLDEARKKVHDLAEQLKKDQAQIKLRQAALATAPPDSLAAIQAEVAALQGGIEKLESQLKLYRENQFFQTALKRSGNASLMRYVASVREPENRKHTYMVVKTNGRGLFTESAPDTTKTGEFNYYGPISNWFDWNKLLTLIAVLIFGIDVVVFVNLAKRGKDLYLRPIAGLQEIDNAVGRATEMGRPMLYCMGNGGLSDVATLASMGILGQVARKAAEYDTKLVVPCYDYIVMPIAQEIVREAHYAVGRPDTFDKNNVFYLTSAQFAYVAGVNGIMIRERMATNFFLGYFAAEALLMTETGNAVGAVQIAGSDAITQIPFFITTCDYTLIGEELYAASAYLNREPMLLGTLKAQDYFKFLILVFVIAGAVLASFQVTGLMQLFPLK